MCLRYFIYKINRNSRPAKKEYLLTSASVEEINRVTMTELEFSKSSNDNYSVMTDDS